MNVKNLAIWACQIVAAAILFWAGVSKFLSTETSVSLFTALGMEPFGRFLIATIECAAALLLLTSMFSAIGAIVAVSTMTGAAIAHLTHLGFAPGGDGGRMVLFLALELVSAGIVLYVRRKNIPFLGETL